jgi:hypothetical protein
MIKMNKINPYKKERNCEIIDVYENVVVFYKDGYKRIYDAIYLLENGALTGHLIPIDKNNGLKSFLNSIKQSINNKIKNEFIEHGFIPNYNIQRIENKIKKSVLRRVF